MTLALESPYRRSSTVIRLVMFDTLEVKLIYSMGSLPNSGDRVHIGHILPPAGGTYNTFKPSWIHPLDEPSISPAPPPTRCKTESQPDERTTPGPIHPITTQVETLRLKYPNWPITT